MTAVRDETGRVLIQTQYDGDRVVQQTSSSGASCGVRYTWAKNNAYATEAAVRCSGGPAETIPAVEAVPQFLIEYKRR